MKKLLISLGLMFALAFSSIASASYGVSANSSDFKLEGPNHKDFLRLVNDLPYLTESLYHIPSSHYWGPATLAQFNILYADYVKTGVMRTRFANFLQSIVVK